MGREQTNNEGRTDTCLHTSHVILPPLFSFKFFNCRALRTAGGPSMCAHGPACMPGAVKQQPHCWVREFPRPLLDCHSWLCVRVCRRVAAAAGRRCGLVHDHRYHRIAMAVVSSYSSREFRWLSESNNYEIGPLLISVQRIAEGCTDAVARFWVENESLFANTPFFRMHRTIAIQQHHVWRWDEAMSPSAI